MATLKHFKELDSWKLARELENYIYNLTQIGGFSKDFELKDQINRSTGSVMDNIAGGFGRGSNKEFINFLIVAKASCIEAQSQLIRAYDRTYINEEIKLFSMKLADEAIASITNFINYLRTDFDRTIRKPIS